MTGWLWAFVVAVGLVAYFGGRCRQRQADRDLIGQWEQATQGWRARARAAEDRLRAERVAPVVPFTCQPNMGEQRQGFKVIQGGAR